MVIWKGWGFLALVIWAISVGGVRWIYITFLDGSPDYASAIYPKWVSAVMASVIILLVDQFLLREKIPLKFWKVDHHVFFVPLRFVPILILLYAQYSISHLLDY